MEKHEYWIDDDNYLACGTGDDYETVANIIAQQHIEPLTAIIESQPELLDACRDVEEAWAGCGDMATAVDSCLLAIAKAELKIKD